jgi:hypothetical protein
MGMLVPPALSGAPHGDANLPPPPPGANGATATYKPFPRHVGRVKRSAADLDALIGISCRDCEDKPGGIAARIRRQTYKEKLRLLDRDDSDDPIALTVIGGKPLPPPEVLAKLAAARHQGGAGDPPSFVAGGTLTWGGMSVPGFEAPIFQQVPEPSAIGAVAMGSAGILLRRRRE